MKDHYRSKGCEYIRHRIAEKTSAETAMGVFGRASQICEELLATDTFARKGIFDLLYSI